MPMIIIQEFVKEFIKEKLTLCLKRSKLGVTRAEKR